ncbi:hypothetical protein ACH5RR_023921 [Cinchona calisaya]|uniref:Cornichon n=1 Tax=Cinchona calisaya TaxID=153742 RepID=A0ABD2ZC09_9GENT
MVYVKEEIFRTNLGRKLTKFAPKTVQHSSVTRVPCLYVAFAKVVVLCMELGSVSGNGLLMCLADLEFDYINPFDSASKINKVVLPEFITQGVLCFLHLVTRHWIMFLLCLPYLYYNFKLYTQHRHLVDVTEIFNQLPREKKIRLYKLGYLIVLMACSIFWMIWSIVEDEHY